MEVDTMALVERLEAAASGLEKTLGWLEERQRFLSVEVDRISATVESSRREEELAAKLAEAERELAELKAAAAPEAHLKGPQPLRRTQTSGAAQMLGKQGIGLEGGEGALDIRALDAALSGLSLEQRIAVKSQLRRGLASRE
jgi:hypothetical protein